MAEQEQVVSTTRQMAKTATAVVIGGSLLLLSGVTLVATVIGLALATPLAVICSPVLVPAAITVFLIISGFLISAGFGMAAIFTTAWIYKYLTGKRPVGLDSLEQARVKIVSKARDVKEQYTH